jgi:hypothetical protein
MEEKDSCNGGKDGDGGNAGKPYKRLNFLSAFFKWFFTDQERWFQWRQSMRLLKSVKTEWIDFNYWAYLQLMLLDMPSEEYSEQMGKAEKRHGEREKAFFEYQEETRRHMDELIRAGEHCSVVNQYSLVRGHSNLLKAWRSL